jgi:hypothetical protein
VDGEAVERAGRNEPLRLPAGKHHLLVTGENIQTVNESFIVVRGENPVLRVKIVPKPARGRYDDDHERRRRDDDHERRRYDDDDDHERRHRDDGERKRRRHDDDDD